MNIDYLAGKAALSKDKHAPTTAIPNYSTIKYIVVETTISSYGKKLLESQLAELKSTNDLLGVETKLPELTIGNCGIQAKVLVLSYTTLDQNEVVLAKMSKDGTTIEVTGKPEYFILDQLALDLADVFIRSAKYPAMFMKYFKGGLDDKEDIVLTFTPAFPLPLKDPDRNESNRNKFETGIAYYETAPESDKVKILKALLGRQHLWHSKDSNGKIIYHSAEIGLVGYGFLRISEKGYIEVSSYGYNKESGKEEIYVESKYSQSPTEKVVSALTTFIAEETLKRNAKGHDQLPEKVSEEVDDVPF